MRFLLSTIGSRGDVQPLVALAMELRALEQDVRFCVPPDFQNWIEGLGFPVGTDRARAAQGDGNRAPRTSCATSRPNAGGSWPMPPSPSSS